MYAPSDLPSGPAFESAVRNEFQKLAMVLAGPQDYAILRPLHVDPVRRIEGMIVLADGVGFNPTGGGEGVYQWRSGAWHFLG